MRRGCVIEALRKFIISQGPSKNINNLEWASFWAENKKAIDPVAKRYACVNKGNWYIVALPSLIIASLSSFVDRKHQRSHTYVISRVIKKIRISGKRRCGIPAKSL